MSDTCLNCGGFIGDPGVSYGYTGKWCYCLREPQIQRPASKETNMTVKESEMVWKRLYDENKAKDAQIKALEAQNKKMREALEFIAGWDCHKPLRYKETVRERAAMALEESND